MKTNKRARNALSALVAGAAALLLAVGGASVANAEGPGLANSPLILPGEGGEPIQGTVTIHKHEQEADAGAPANGLEQDIDTPEIPGVEFTAQQITSVTSGGTTHDIDLTTNQGWLNAAQLVRAADGSWTFKGVPAMVTLEEAGTENTGPEGGTYKNAVFEDLDVGLYLFTETDAPANVTKSAPWVMTVPLTDPVGDGENIGPNERWNYDLHVYPKNSITALDKTVQDAGATSVGDTISWTITGDIPLVANPEFDADVEVSVDNLKFFAPTAYVIKDVLDERLTPASTNPVAVAMINGVALTADVDYTVAWDPGATTAGAEMTLTFTEEGRNKLGLAVSQATAPAEVKVRVVLSTVITSLSEPEADAGTIGDGIIKNRAELFPNQSAVDSETPVLSPEPQSRWGDILIEKVDARDKAVKLQGAEFQIFTTLENALARNVPVTINDKSTFTTDEDGVVRISGLRYSDWANNAPITDEADWQYYWIVETKSPEGYELLAEPIRVTVTQAQQTVESATVIENVPTNGGFELPLTGGTGTTLFTITGLLLIGGGLVFALRKKKTA